MRPIAYTNYSEALARLKDATKLESSYIDALNRDESELASIFTDKTELDKRISAATNCTTLINKFADLHATFTLSLNGYQGINKDQLDKLRDAGKESYSKGLEFLNALLKDGRYNATHVNLLDRIISDATAVMKDPKCPSEQLTKLEMNIAKLRPEMETGAMFYANTAGRLFLGSLTALLGAALMTAGLAVGLVAGLFPLGKHWGPLTWGSQVVKYGVDLATSGPTLFQRKLAPGLSKQMTDLSARAKEIQKPAVSA